jgi:ferredoxin, 2Fe-2S
MSSVDLIADRPVGQQPPAADSRADVETTLRLVVIDHAGDEHTLESLEGWRVMEVIRDWGVPIKAECGGACACGTCHVYVDEAWLDRLIPPTAEEEAQLDHVAGIEPSSRLSCQLLMRPDLDGLKVRLAPGSEV